MINIILLTAFGNIFGVPHADKDSVRLLFQIDQNREVYEETLFGEPPQLAIWLENPTEGTVKTVYVTRRTATGDFEGKMGVPVALPGWIVAYRKETGRNDFPTPATTLTDAITGATQKQEVSREVLVSRNSLWNYYIEVNVSGDFNGHFTNYRSNGEMDPHLNGQPSLIYKGTIIAKPGEKSTPKLIGRTEQYNFSDKINPDTEKVTTAKNLLKSIRVSCLETGP